MERLLRPLAGVTLAAIIVSLLDAVVILSGLADTTPVWLGVLLLTVQGLCFSAGSLALLLAWLRSDTRWCALLAPLALVGLYGRSVFDFAPALRDTIFSVAGSIAHGEIVLDVLIPLPIAVAAFLYAYTILNAIQPRAATPSQLPES